MASSLSTRAGATTPKANIFWVSRALEIQESHLLLNMGGPHEREDFQLADQLFGGQEFPAECDQVKQMLVKDLFGLHVWFGLHPHSLEEGSSESPVLDSA